MVVHGKNDSQKRLEKAKRNLLEIRRRLQEIRSQQNEQYFRDLDPFAKEELDSLKQERKLRKGFAIWATVVVSGWLLFIGFVVFSVGKSWLIYSDGVLMTLLATTTVNVIALSVVIAKGLFPDK